MWVVDFAKLSRIIKRANNTITANTMSLVLFYGISSFLLLKIATPDDNKKIFCVNVCGFGL